MKAGVLCFFTIPAIMLVWTGRSIEDEKKVKVSVKIAYFPFFLQKKSVPLLCFSRFKLRIK